MAVDPILEDFAFALFRKVWIKNGFMDYTEKVPDYPAVLFKICPDDLSDAVYDFQSICSPLFEKLCEQHYDNYAHSRSDFLYFLSCFFHSISEHRSYLMIITLAALAAEMGLACARRGNYMFVFSSPLSFAMAFEEGCRAYIESIGTETILRELISTCSNKFRHIKMYLCWMGRSASCRRTVIHRLQLVRCELNRKEGYEEFCGYLTFVVKVGGMLDHPGMSSESLKYKLICALEFVDSLEEVHNQKCYPHLECCIVDDNLAMQFKDQRRLFFLEIAFLCDLDEDEANTFVALYEETVLIEKVGISPHPCDSFSVFQMNCLDCNSKVTCEKQKDDRCLDNRDTAPKSKDPRTSDPPSLYELYDLKPKSMESQDMLTDCNLDALSESQRTEDPSYAISDAPSVEEDLVPNERDTSPKGTRTSVIQFSSVTSSNLFDEVCDAPSSRIPFEDALHLPYESPGTDRQDSTVKCIDTSSQHIQKTSPDYVKPSLNQSHETCQRDDSTGCTFCDTDPNYVEVHEFSSKISKYVTPPLSEQAEHCQSTFDFEPKGLGKYIDHCEGHSVDDQTEDFQLTKSKKDYNCTEICVSPPICETALKRNVDPGHELDDKRSPCRELLLTMDKETLLTSLEPNQPSNVTEVSASDSLKNSFKSNETTNHNHILSSKDTPSALSAFTPRSFSKVSRVFPKVVDSVPTRDTEIEDVQSDPLIESLSKEENSLCSKDSTSSLDIFSEQRLISESHTFVKNLENSKLLELKDDKTVAKDRESSQPASKLEIQEVSSIGITAMDPEISEEISAFQVKDEEISIDTFTSNLRNEGFLETSNLELINQERPRTCASIVINQETSSDNYCFHSGNTNIFKNSYTSKFNDTMDIKPDSSASQYHAKGTNFEQPDFELSSTKNIISSTEACLKFKRVVEADDTKDLKITVYFSHEFRDEEINFCTCDFECKNQDTFYTEDAPVLHDSFGEEHADFKASGKCSSLSSPMDVGDNEKVLIDDSQPPAFDIFDEQYLKLEEEKVFEDSNAFNEPVTSEPCPLHIVDVFSINPETFSELETYSETLSMSPTPSVCTVVSVESKIVRNSENIVQSEEPQETMSETVELHTTEANPQKVEDKLQNEPFKRVDDASTRLTSISQKLNTKGNDDANPVCEHQLVQEHSSPKLCRKDATLGSKEETTLNPKQKEASVNNLQEQKSSTKDEQLESSKTRDDCSKFIEDMPYSTPEGKDKSKKRNKKKKKEQGETQGPKVVGNDPGEPQNKDSNVYQLILVMGVPFQNPIEEERFMNRIAI